MSETYKYEIIGTDGLMKFIFYKKLEDMKDGKHRIDYFSDRIETSHLTKNNYYISVSKKKKKYSIFATNENIYEHIKIFSGTYYGIQNFDWGSLKLIE